MKKIVLALLLLALFLVSAIFLQNELLADDPPIWESCTLDPVTGILICPTSTP